MVKLRTYIGKLKTDIIKDYKKKLDKQLESDLLSLQEEKKSLTKLSKDKKSALKLQKKLVSDTYKSKQKEASVEAKKIELLQDIWEASLDMFFDVGKNNWYESLVQEIPKEKGTLKYSPNTPSPILKKIKKDNPKLDYVEEKNIEHGFVYVSDKYVIEMTRGSFSDQHLPKYKRILYKDLGDII